MSSTSPSSSSSSSPSLVTKVLLVLLSLWFLASLILIVVWSTHPKLRGSPQCQQNLREREQLELLLYEARQDTESLREQRTSLLGTMAATNRSLWESRQEYWGLRANFSILREEAEQLSQKVENLTSLLQEREEEVELLNHNISQTKLEVVACVNLKEAAQSHMTAAQSLTEACRTDRTFLHRQLSNR